MTVDQFLFLLLIISFVGWRYLSNFDHETSRQRERKQALIEEQKRLRYADKIETAWRAQRNLQFEPIHAQYYGNQPRIDHSDVLGSEGLIGLVDNTLTYTSHLKINDVVIPLNMIRWIGHHEIQVKSNFGTKSTNALIIHYEELTIKPGKTYWRMAAFTSFGSYRILGKLGELTHLPWHDLGPLRPDLGPLEAMQFEQDIYGQWHMGYPRQLYLIPDRLLRDFDETIPIDRIRRIEVIKYGSRLTDRILLEDDLLRLEFQNDKGTYEVMGYMTAQASQLASKLSRYTDLPYQTIDGRKKKMK